MLRTQFTPRHLANLQLWLDAGDTSVLFDATTGGSLPAADGGVARWVDKSANAHAFTQGTLNNRPLRKTNSQNGRDGILFDGSNDSLYKAANVFDAGVTYAVVAKLTSSTARSPVADIGNYASRSLIIEANTFSTVGSRWGLYSASGVTSNATFDSNQSTSTSAAIVVFAADMTSGNDITTNSDYRVNGVSATLTRRNGSANTSGDYTANSGTMIGSYNNRGSPAFVYAGMTLYEMLVFDRRLSEAECRALERYFAARWAITI